MTADDVVKALIGVVVVASMIGSAFRRRGQSPRAAQTFAPGPQPGVPPPAARPVDAVSSATLHRRAAAAADAARLRAQAPPRPVVSVATPPSPMRTYVDPSAGVSLGDLGLPAMPPSGMPDASTMGATATAPPPPAGGRSFVDALRDPLRTRDAVVLSEILGPPPSLRPHVPVR